MGTRRSAAGLQLLVGLGAALGCGAKSGLDLYGFGGGDGSPTAAPTTMLTTTTPSGCDGQADGSACDDGDPCTSDDRCAEGGCAGTPGACPNVGPSCAGGLQCADGLSCCHSVGVPGGSFQVGDPNRFSWGAQPEHPARVSPFALDTFEVVVGRFRAFVEAYTGAPPAAGAGAHPRIAGTGWQPAWNGALPSSRAALIAGLKCDEPLQAWTDAGGSAETLPINCVTWYEAFAFCAWDGGRLPTETEWEYAAAGGAENRIYPWGSAEPDDHLANWRCEGDGNPGSCAPGDILAVGSHPAGNGRWGHRDLAGNMWEWTFDGLSLYTPASCDDCATVDELGGRVVRGGRWTNYHASFLRVAYRRRSDSLYRSSDLGFRCARDPR